MQRIVMAIGTHPDDIEFMMAGTLILLKNVGCEIHYMNIANGSCGTNKYPVEEIVRIRKNEALQAAQILEAIYHESLVNDLEIYYEKEILSRLAAVIRTAAPDILLIPSAQDYMEDHKITSRLAVTAAFCRGMRNFGTIPETEPIDKEMVLYHALPYGLMDELRQPVIAGLYIDISKVLSLKRNLLAQHKSQKEWLDVSQGYDAYLQTMEKMSEQVGFMSGVYKYAEGWCRHSHIGFSGMEVDLLAQILKNQSLIAAD